MAISGAKNITELLEQIGADIAKKRVLLVDRHSHARESLRSLLYASLRISAIFHAGSSADVLRQVQKEKFDIIIADYQLDDGRDGQQLLEELRKRRLVPRTTVYIMLTAERNYASVISVAELTPDAYLIKPFNAEMLQDRLVRACYKKSFFKHVLVHLDKGYYTEALSACNALTGKEPGFYFDLLRFKAETLSVLGRHEEAGEIFSHVIKTAKFPWGKMGLASVLREMGKSAEAEAVAISLIKECPEYLAAYDFAATIREELGMLTEAQEVLQKANSLSPKNAERNLVIGNIAVRNNDLDTAERAYAKVLEFRRGSSLRSIDDYTNLSRVFLAKGQIEAARKISQDLLRDRRGDGQSELAATIVESLCCSQENEADKARKCLEKALALRESLEGEADSEAVSQKISVDLAHACLAADEEDLAHEILSKVAAENHEDRGIISQIQGVFSQTGKEQDGQSLLARVGKEIVELNNKGVLAARSGNLEASVEMLTETADRVPNVQFLVNAAKAIFMLLERNGWDGDLVERGLYYLNLAKEKNPRNTKVIAVNEFYRQVSQKLKNKVAAA